MANTRYKAAPLDEPTLDISSMIDCSFLLLCYFIAVGTLDSKEAALSMTLPTSQGSSSSVTIDQMTVHLKADNVVLVNDDIVDTEVQGRERTLVGLKARLSDYKQAADAVASTAIVVLAADDEAKGQPFVDVLNTLADVGINNVTLQGFVSSK